MIRIAHIKDGKILNVSLSREGATLPDGAMLESDAIAAGYERAAVPVIAEPLPDAEKYQVLDWLDDHGITSAHVDAALQSIPDETQRRKALLRWHSVNRIPADNAFVVHAAQQLNIDHREAWSQILAK
jgi:hypothetical protein